MAAVTDFVFHHLPFMLRPQKKHSGEPALSTTEEEMTDLLYLTCREFHRRTGHYPYLNYDNNKIQQSIGLDPQHPDQYRLSSEHGEDIVMPKDHRLPQPPHSPDCNRPVEHQFGSGKTRLRNDLYLKGVRITTGAQLQTRVHEEFSKYMPEFSVRKDVEHLPLLWEVISTTRGEAVYVDDEGKVHVGSGGDWGQKGSM